jgi:hypothetical protein
MSFAHAKDSSLRYAVANGNDIVAEGVAQMGDLVATRNVWTMIAEASEVEFLGALAGKVGFPPLPATGEPVKGGQVYAYNGGHVLARQDHIRTHHAPDDEGMLALFVVWRENADEVLPWLYGEQLEKGALRTHNGKTWRALQNPGVNIWEPGSAGTEALWAEYVEVVPGPTIPNWVSGEALTYVAPTNGANAADPTSDWPEAVYRMHNGVKYRLRQNPGVNIWTPPTVPAIWLAIPA